VASLRGERDIAIGNIVGSNIMNIVVVLAISAMVAPDGLAISVSARLFDIPVMIIAAVACLPIFYTGQTIARWEGVLFVSYYVAYVTYLLLNATHHAALAGFSLIMTSFVIPLTIITLWVLTHRAMRDRSRRS
jgi:cation:H+ antiporter